jgi:hypothetical protein
MKITSNSWVFLSTALLLLGALPQSALAIRYDQKYIEAIKKSEGITPIGVDSFGENLDISSGSVEFKWTDIDIPGNNALPVRLQRSLAIQDTVNAAQELGGFGPAGNLDLPYVEGLFSSSTGWQVNGTNPNSRCSMAANGQPSFSGGSIAPADYSNGNSMHIPWAGDQAMLTKPAATLPLQGGTVATLITKNFWIIRCLPATKNGIAGEGFMAIAPNGDKYYFDWVVNRDGGKLTKRIANYGSGTASITRTRVFFLVSRIEDKSGNWVNYTYIGDKLNRISASDGRYIQIDAWNGNNIASVSSSVGSWSYVYTSNSLVTTQPDGQHWTIAATGLLEIVPTPSLPLYTGKPTCPVPDLSDGSYSLAVTQPSGATATFSFGVVRHFKSNVPRLCNSFIDGALSSYQYLTIPNFNDSFTLQSKTISGLGLNSMQWQYSYSGGGFAAFADVCSDPPSEFACPKTRSTTVRGPDRSYKRYTFSNMYDLNSGQLWELEEGYETGVAPNIQVVIERETTHDYVTVDEVGMQLFPDKVGMPLHSRLDYSELARLRPEKRTQIVQDGRTFTRTVAATGCSGTAYCFDVFARPTKTIKASAPYVAPQISATAPSLTVPSTNATGAYAISWTAVLDATSYELEESVSGAWTQIQESSALTRSFSGKETNTYGYRVKACNSLGCGPLSMVKSIQVTSPVPSAPTLTMATYYDHLNFTTTWTSAATATSYRLEVSADLGATWSQIYSGPNLSFATSQPNLTNYGYRVKACNANGCGAYSAEKYVSVELDACPTCFMAPPPDETSSLNPIFDAPLLVGIVQSSPLLMSNQMVLTR